MCGKCDEIVRKIGHYEDLAMRILDQQTLDGIATLITELATQKTALHPEERK
jgi:hypothetical protein